MTGIRDILISTVDKSYHITIDSRINIIRGDSGIGKMDFFELIRVDEGF